MSAKPCDDIIEIMDWVNGNGKPGAKTRMAIIERRQDTLETTLKTMNDNISKAVGWVVGGAITAIVGILIWFFTVMLPKIIAVI
jgi:tetrahydromethanopterin S-methyltransferase subunit G